MEELIRELLEEVKGLRRDIQATNRSRYDDLGPLITDLGYGGCTLDYNPTTKVYDPCTHRLSDMPDGLLKPLKPRNTEALGA